MPQTITTHSLHPGLIIQLGQASLKDRFHLDHSFNDKTFMRNMIEVINQKFTIKLSMPPEYHHYSEEENKYGELLRTQFTPIPSEQSSELASALKKIIKLLETASRYDLRLNDLSCDVLKGSNKTDIFNILETNYQIKLDQSANYAQVIYSLAHIPEDDIDRFFVNHGSKISQSKSSSQTELQQQKFFNLLVGIRSIENKLLDSKLLPHHEEVAESQHPFISTLVSNTLNNIEEWHCLNYPEYIGLGRDNWYVDENKVKALYDAGKIDIAVNAELQKLFNRLYLYLKILPKNNHNEIVVQSENTIKKESDEQILAEKKEKVIQRNLCIVEKIYDQIQNFDQFIDCVYPALHHDFDKFFYLIPSKDIKDIFSLWLALNEPNITIEQDLKYLICRLFIYREELQKSFQADARNIMISDDLRQKIYWGNKTDVLAFSILTNFFASKEPIFFSSDDNKFESIQDIIGHLLLLTLDHEQKKIFTFFIDQGSNILMLCQKLSFDENVAKNIIDNSIKILLTAEISSQQQYCKNIMNILGEEIFKCEDRAKAAESLKTALTELKNSKGITEQISCDKWDKIDNLIKILSLDNISRDMILSQEESYQNIMDILGKEILKYQNRSKAAAIFQKALKEVKEASCISEETQVKNKSGISDNILCDKNSELLLPEDETKCLSEYLSVLLRLGFKTKPNSAAQEIKSQKECEANNSTVTDILEIHQNYPSDLGQISVRHESKKIQVLDKWCPVFNLLVTIEPMKNVSIKVNLLLCEVSKNSFAIRPLSYTVKNTLQECNTDVVYDNSNRNNFNNAIQDLLKKFYNKLDMKTKNLIQHLFFSKNDQSDDIQLKYTCNSHVNSCASQQEKSVSLEDDRSKLKYSQLKNSEDDSMENLSSSSLLLSLAGERSTKQYIFESMAKPSNISGSGQCPALGYTNIKKPLKISDSGQCPILGYKNIKNTPVISKNFGPQSEMSVNDEGGFLAKSQERLSGRSETVLSENETASVCGALSCFKWCFE